MAKSRTPSTIITIILLSTVALATPDIPNRFYGHVNYMDGLAPDGTIVEARIDGATIVSTTTLGGNYGYVPNVFDVTDPDGNRVGKTISFFVNGADTGKTAVFANGKASELDLTINEYVKENSKTNEQTTTSSSGNSGGNNPSTNIRNTSCASEWYCTDWSSCSKDSQTRKCADINHCATSTSKPVLSQDCAKPVAAKEEGKLPVLDISKKEEGETKQQSSPTGAFSAITSNNVGIVAVILVLVAVIFYLRKK